MLEDKSKNIQIIYDGTTCNDGKKIKINMRGHSFTAVLDGQDGTFDFKGDVPKQVKENPQEFAEWLVPKLVNICENGDFSKIQ